MLIVGLVLLGLVIKEYQRSQVVGHLNYRFNLALIAPERGLTFVSFDPAEKSILALPYPTNLAITSRTRGEYAISSLYKLGSYQGEGGKFARQKIQGFMRVPVPGYLVYGGAAKKPKTQLSSALLKALLSPGKIETSLSRFDAFVLLYRTSRYSLREVSEDELLRASVIERKGDQLLYHAERLQEYVGTRLFDWEIGAGRVSVAIVNASGENGLGSDMADFLSNLGFDVVMVRSVSDKDLLDHSEWQVESHASEDALDYVFQNLFGLGKPTIDQISSEFRSQVVIRVGKDAKELF